MENIRYRTIFPFQVMTKLTDGETVYMLDRQTVKALCVNDLTVGCLAEVLRDEDTASRYEFWIVEEAEDAEL